VAEGARLESVFTGNRNVGSNPTPSARPSSFWLGSKFALSRSRNWPDLVGLFRAYVDARCRLETTLSAFRRRKYPVVSKLSLRGTGVSGEIT
jgi:hypothetical protein